IIKFSSSVGILLKIWSHPPGLNRRPADYESAALPAELGWPTWTHSERPTLILAEDQAFRRSCQVSPPPLFDADGSVHTQRSPTTSPDSQPHAARTSDGIRRSRTPPKWSSRQISSSQPVYRGSRRKRKR